MTRPDVSGRADRLLVIIPDRLTALIEKGEIIDRYYNPGELFREVHLLSTTDDRPDAVRLQKTVGGAKLYLHNLPAGRKLFLRSLGWQPLLLKGWIKRGISLAKAIAPDLVRTHNNFLEGYLAKKIKDSLDIPYVISLHGVWDRDPMITTRQKIMKIFLKKFERISLRNSDAVIAVYQPIFRYAREYGAKNIHLIYNAVASRNISTKAHYQPSRPPRLITINRQVAEKNPENIIRAVQNIDCRYLIVGDGLYHDRLVALAKKLDCHEKIEFVKAMPNKELCGLLKDYDIMVAHCDYWGISKTTIEAALTGLPIILNKHPVEPIPDLDGDWLLLCDNTPAGYGSAIRTLLESESLRSEYGKKARAHALAHFDPDKMEQDLVALYRDVLASAASRESHEPVS
jgi:glycosyltransferase involved in cell wall biosynthesis